jgi:acyl carrier protein
VRNQSQIQMEIRTTYETLRKTTDNIIALVSKMSGLEKDEISISSAINNDLGIDGDDWVDLQKALEKQEGLSLDGLQFYDYFNDEGQIGDTTGFIIGLFQFIWYVVSLKWLKMKFEDYHKPLGPPKDVLTIADLITSKYEGRFVKRSERKYVFT